MATRDDVARLAGVSPATVSNVLTGRKYVSPELTQKIQWAVRELNYTPNLMARALVTSRSYQLALLVHEIANPYYAEIAEGMEEVARVNGYTVSFSVVHDGMDELEYFNTIRQRRFDGVLDFTISSFSPEQLRWFGENAIAYVSAGDNQTGSQIQFIYFEAVNRLMQHLSAYGHENVAFISGLPDNAQDERFLAYCNYIQAAGREVNKRYIRYGGYPKYRSFDLGYRYAREILAECPEVTAIFALNDLMAYGAIKAIRDMGKSVPEDISVVGCDDIFTSGLLNPALTTITVNKFGVGRMAAQLLIDQIETGKTERVFENAGLTIRDSVAYNMKKR